MVAVTHRRCDDIDCVGVTVGEAPLMSMTMAPLELPPNCRMRPGANIAVLELELVYEEESWPTWVMEPVPPLALGLT